jgi:serine/threonine-protein kinase RsbW
VPERSRRDVAVGTAGIGVVLRILQLQLDSHPESLGDARRQVRDAMMHAGLDLDAARNMEIAVGEALSNVYQHAYRTGIGPVLVEVLRTSTGLTVTVSDEGDAVATPVIPRMLPPRTKPGGRGLYMIRRLVDDLEICVGPKGHGVTVRMTAPLQAGQARASAEGAPGDGARGRF